MILFDSEVRLHLLPLTYTRPVAGLRAGMMTIGEKWQAMTKQLVSFMVPQYMKPLFPCQVEAENVLIEGGLLPTSSLIDALTSLKPGQALFDTNNNLLAMVLTRGQLEQVMNFDEFFVPDTTGFEKLVYRETVSQITRPWHLFSSADALIRADFEELTRGRSSMPLAEGNRVVNANDVFIEEGAKVSFSIINASAGPVHIGRNAEVMENCVIRGPFAMGEGSVLKMGAKIYGPTVLGPGCKVGGEVNNSVFQANANKAHDGFLGNAVIGEWCNLGADTNNSNLKNTYEEVKLWSHVTQGFVKTGLQFCGLIMGDHSKCSINTMFNTGTVVGVSCNLYGDGFHRNFIPSFSWGSSHHMTSFQFEKAMLVAERVLARRGLTLSEPERNMLLHVFNLSISQRNY